MIIHVLLATEVQEGQDEPEQKFMAMGQAHVSLPNYPTPCPIQFQFQIPGRTITEAFANFAAAFEKASGEAQAQARSEHRKRQLTNLIQ